MDDPHWTSYIGIVGAITGSFAFILSWFSYRKVNSIKSLDLRIGLKKAVSDVSMAINNLEELMPKAISSKGGIEKTIGIHDSSNMNIIKQEYEKDKESVNRLKTLLPKKDQAYDKLSPYELERKLIEIHNLQNTINSYADKYTASMDEDKKEREQHRADLRADRFY